jgi:hypothetical protein
MKRWTLLGVVLSLALAFIVVPSHAQISSPNVIWVLTSPAGPCAPFQPMELNISTVSPSLWACNEANSMWVQINTGSSGTGDPGGSTYSTQTNAGGGNFGGTGPGLAGQIYLAQGSGGPALFLTLSGDCTILLTGAVTCTKSSGTSFGTAAFQNIGTSGGNVPLLNGTNTWSGPQTFGVSPTIPPLATGCIQSAAGLLTSTGLPCLNGASAVPPYTQAVVAQTSVSISEATHLQGALAVAYCFNNSTPALSGPCDYTRDSSGNLVFTFNPAFTGTIEIGSGGGTAANLAWINVETYGAFPDAIQPTATVSTNTASQNITLAGLTAANIGNVIWIFTQNTTNTFQSTITGVSGTTVTLANFPDVTASGRIVVYGPDHSTQIASAAAAAIAAGTCLYIPGSPAGAYMMVNMTPISSWLPGPCVEGDGPDLSVLVAGVNTPYFIDANEVWNSETIENFKYYGGAGFLRNRFTGVNVRRTHNINHVYFRDFSADALSWNASDLTYLDINGCQFYALNTNVNPPTIGIAVAGPDQGVIRNNDFVNQGIAIKLGLAGNTLRIFQNDFIEASLEATPGSYTRVVGVWYVPEATNSSPLSAINSQNKYGNENADVLDVKNLFADSVASSGSNYFGETTWIASASTGYVRNVSFINDEINTASIMGSGVMPFIYSYTPNAFLLNINASLDSSIPGYIVQFDSSVASSVSQSPTLASTIGPFVFNRASVNCCATGPTGQVIVTNAPGMAIQAPGGLYHGLQTSIAADTVNIVDEFSGGYIGTSQSIGNLKWGTTLITATGCTFGASTNSSNTHPGVLAVTTPAVSTDGCSMYLGTGAPAGATGILGTTGSWWSEYIAQTSTITNMAWRLGFGTPATAATIPTNGIYFRFDTTLSDTTIMACVDTTSTETCTSTGQTPVANTFYDYYINSVTAATIVFQVGANAPVTICASGCTATATPPTALVVPMLINVTETSGATTTALDYFQFVQSGLTR